MTFQRLFSVNGKPAILGGIDSSTFLQNLCEDDVHRPFRDSLPVAP